MLHFDEISARAGELERMAAGFAASGSVDQPSLLEVLGRLQSAIEKACAERPVSEAASPSRTAR
jgi:hypothetical protein